MRYLVLFMILVGIFVVGSRSCDGISFFFGGERGEGPVKSETRPATGFHAVNVALPGATEVRVADQYSVVVHAQENLLPLLKTTVENGVLRCYFDKNVSHAEGLKIEISGPAFDGFELAGSGTLRVLTPLHGDHLDLAIGGSGTIELPLADVRNVQCSIAGSGDIQIGGKAETASFEIAGSGDIAAKGLLANTGEASIAGSGSVTCNVAQSLKAGIAGSGDIFYTGSPTVDTDISGSGKVKRVD